MARWIDLDPTTTTDRWVDGLLKKSKPLAVVEGDRYLDDVVLRDLHIGDLVADDSLQIEAEAHASEGVEPSEGITKLCPAHVVQAAQAAVDCEPINRYPIREVNDLCGESDRGVVWDRQVADYLAASQRVALVRGKVIDPHERTPLKGSIERRICFS